MSTASGLTAASVEAFERCVRSGGVAVFPADTVYGLACHPAARGAVERLYRLKGRPGGQPAAVLFFELEPALRALPELGPRTREALRRLLPGGVTVLLPNPRRRFPLAGGEGTEALGLRVPDLAGSLAPLRGVSVPVLQSSANRSGAPDVRRVADLELSIRRGVDLVLDAGALPGTPSTVVDLTRYEEHGEHRLAREGALSSEEVASHLGWSP